MDELGARGLEHREGVARLHRAAEEARQLEPALLRLVRGAVGEEERAAEGRRAAPRSEVNNSE